MSITKDLKDKKINYDNLIFIAKRRNRKTDFSLKKGSLDFLNEIKKVK